MTADDVWQQALHTKTVSTFYITSPNFDAMNVIIKLLLVKKIKKIKIIIIIMKTFDKTNRIWLFLTPYWFKIIIMG